MNKRKIYKKVDLLFKMRKLEKLVQYASESNSDSDDDETHSRKFNNQPYKISDT